MSHEFTGERVIPGQVDRDLWNEHMSRYAFAARLARQKRVLDAGCGTGYGAAELCRTANSVVAVDVSAEALEHARTTYPFPNLQFLQASCTSLPLRDDAVDLLVALEVIEHLAEWQKFLTEAQRILAPGGQLVVSTPNKLYYAETRQKSGPNPFHEHEFDFEEFRDALESLFPHVSFFLQNHASGIIFRPPEDRSRPEIRLAGSPWEPHTSHFFVAVCAMSAQTGAPTFVYFPSASNVLREREHHIRILEAELATKDHWLQQSQRDHSDLLDAHRDQTAALERANTWAQNLNTQLQERAERVLQLQQELKREQAEAADTAAAYENKISALEQENQAKTDWAIETESRLHSEIEAKSAELVKCVDLLHDAERTIEERTHWALDLEQKLRSVEALLNMYRASRWTRVGRAFGVGPEARKS